jgi:hypothetical protein
VCTRSIVGLMVALACAGVAAEGPATLEVVVPEGTVSVGDRVPVRVVARGGDGLLWGELRVVVPTGGPWELVDGPQTVAGARPPAWQVELAPMELGEVPLPDFQVTVRPPDGEPQDVTPASTPSLQVASVLPTDQEAEPAPLKDPVGVEGLPWEWLVPALMVLVPLVAVAAWWLRRRRSKISTDPAFRLPPLEQLKALLEELEPRIGREPAEGLCDRLASGFRRYLERRTGEPALEMTSFELRGLARGRGWPEAVQRSIHRVMEVADGVRFGRKRVVEAELKAAVSAAGEAASDLEYHLDALEQRLEAAS